MKRFLVITLFMAYLFSNCHKIADPVAPPLPSDPVETIATPIDTVTHVIGFGKGSMMFNGEVWPIALRAIAYKNWPNHFYIGSDTLSPNDVRSVFGLLHILCQVGIGPVEDPQGYDDLLNGIAEGVFSVVLQGDQPIARYVSDSTRTDQFFEIIRYDSINQIIEGRFQTFLVKKYDDTPNFPGITVPDTISITEGKFHLKIEKP